MSDWMEWMEWSGVDTPQTVMTTRAPAVLKRKEIPLCFVIETLKYCNCCHCHGFKQIYPRIDKKYS